MRTNILVRRVLASRDDQSDLAGYTLTINQRGMNALARIGLSTAVEEQARLPLSFHIMRHDGRTLVRLPPQEKGPGRIYPVQRQALRDLLLGMIVDPSDVIRWDSKISGYTQNADGSEAFALIAHLNK